MRQVPTEFIQAAQDCYKEYKLLPSIQIGQGVLESAWFTKVTGKFNFFGVKAVGNQSATICWTHELIDNKLTPIMQRFANYDSVQDAFNDHAEFLTNPDGNFTSALPYLSNLAKFVQTIAPIYATDKNYAVNLLNLIQTEGFQQYDLQSTAN